jgi:hypothetical protein
MKEQYEQYGFYGTLTLFVTQSMQPMRKAYFLQKYVHETDPEIKICYASRGNLSSADMEASKVFLKHYRAVPIKLAFIPIAFVVFEYGRMKFNSIFTSSRR